MLLIEDGYVNLSDGKYYYNLKDHQGNNRVVVKEDGTVQETNHYYPFGGVFASTGNVQPYKYNGKELDTKKGLNWYDYGARHYDATLGRWFVVDPLAENTFNCSLYNFCRNNPILRKDFDGLWDVTVHAYNDRATYGYAFLNVTDKNGYVVYSTIVRVEGTNDRKNGFNKRDCTKMNANTPTGVYKIKGWSNRLPKANRLAYGPNDILELDYIKGEAAGLRNGIHIHGGRQENTGGKGNGATLKVTHGCIRMYDEDIAAMKKITELLEMLDVEEQGNKLTVTNDLYKNQDGTYSFPGETENRNDIWKTLATILQINPNITINVIK